MWGCWALAAALPDTECAISKVTLGLCYGVWAHADSPTEHLLIESERVIENGTGNPDRLTICEALGAKGPETSDYMLRTLRALVK